MGACASVPKAMRKEATNVPPPEPREEETSAAAVEKAEGGNDNNQNKVCLVKFISIFYSYFDAYDA